jgi:hypothetical protein
LKSFLRFFAFIGSEKNIGSFDVFDDALQAHRGIVTEVMPNTVQIAPLCFRHFDYVGDFVWLPWVKVRIMGNYIDKSGIDKRGSAMI